jgi:hypothetical protein
MADRVALNIADVTATCRDADSAALSRHAMLVSDIHTDDLPQLCPPATEARFVCTTRPKFTPCTDTLIDPVLPTFVLLIPLSFELSMDSSRVKLPTLTPAVANARRVDTIAPPLTRQLTTVSDCHAVDWQALWSARARLEGAAVPKPAPCSVRLGDPAGAWFWRREPEIHTPSAEKPTVIDPTPSPADTAARRVDTADHAARHAIDVSAIHTVCSYDDAPKRVMLLL